MVCLGAICRAPVLAAAFRAALDEAGVADDVEIGYAGIGDWHVGAGADPRMRAAAEAQGLVLDGVARQVQVEDLRHYDLVLAADRSVREELQALAPDDGSRRRIQLVREFDPEARGDLDVPDPYYGGDEGFAEVVAIARRSAKGLLRHVLELPPA